MVFNHDELNNDELDDLSLVELECDTCEDQKVVTCPACNGAGGHPDGECCQRCFGAGEVGCPDCGDEPDEHL